MERNPQTEIKLFKHHLGLRLKALNILECIFIFFSLCRFTSAIKHVGASIFNLPLFFLGVTKGILVCCLIYDCLVHCSFIASCEKLEIAVNLSRLLRDTI